MRSTEFNDSDDGLERVIVMAKPIERGGGIRLNTQMKAQVVEKAMAHAFDKRKAALRQREYAISKACWLSIFGKAKLAQARALGAPFVLECVDRYGKKDPTGSNITFRFGGKALGMLTLMPVTARNSLDSANDGSSKFSTVKDAKLIADAMAWYDDCEALRAEYEKVKATLTAMLQGISSYNSLEKSWPQGKRFYQSLPKDFPFRHQVPAVLVDQLNKSLGI